MRDDVGSTTMNTHAYKYTHKYINKCSLFLFSSFTVNWNRKGATGRKMENDFSSTGPGHGKICRGFSGAGVKSYDNRSVKRVRGYFIITDCTQTSVHYARPLSLSFSFSSCPPLSLSFSASPLLPPSLVCAYIRITELRAKACW